MFSVLIWTLILGGLIGALLAVPLTAAIKVLYKRYIWQNASMRPMTNPCFRRNIPANSLRTPPKIRPTLKQRHPSDRPFRKIIITHT